MQGDGRDGRLGNGTDPEGATYGEAVALSGGHLFSTLSAGQRMACGLEQASGAALCWGEFARVNLMPWVGILHLLSCYTGGLAAWLGSPISRLCGGRSPSCGFAA